MKVLFLTNTPAPYRVHFFNLLGKMCDLTVLYEIKVAKNRETAWYDSSNTETYKKVFLKGIAIGSESALCFNVFRYLDDKKFDIIVIGGYSTPTGMLAILYLRSKKIPFILNADGGFIKKESHIKYMIKRYFIAGSKGWLSTSTGTNDYLIHYGAKEDNIHIYPFSSLLETDLLNAPPTILQKQKAKMQLGMKEEIIVLSVGRFLTWKGYIYLLHACKDLPSNIGVYIVGGIPTEEYLNIKRKFNLEHVHFVEFMDKKALQEYYFAADMFVLPTYGDIWGLVINEAMAYALPVVTTFMCGAGVALINQGENGILVKPKTVKPLADAIIKISNDVNLRNLMARNSLLAIKKYTIESMTKQIYKVLNLFCKGVI